MFYSVKVVTRDACLVAFSKPQTAAVIAQFTTEGQPVLRPAVAFSKTSFKHRSVQIKGNFTK